MTRFDWHSAPLHITTPVDATYRNTQNVRRFMVAQCGEDFRFTRDLMQWIKAGHPATMADIVAEWRRRQS